MRSRNTTFRGGAFSASIIEAIWNKGIAVPNHDSQIYRKDKCGAWMQRNQYGNTKSQYGWEIDHIKPTSNGGGDNLSNLQPLYWENNRHKSDKYPSWTCLVKAA